MMPGGYALFGPVAYTTNICSSSKVLIERQSKQKKVLKTPQHFFQNVELP